MKKTLKSKVFCLFILLGCISISAQYTSAKDYSKSKGLLRYVDPYIGSGFHGHVFVGTSTPYGMVQLGPNNIHKGWDWCSGYHYSDSIVIGFSHTHLSGTGCTDLGDILLMPFTGKIHTRRGEQDNIENSYASYYSHANEIVRPEYYSLLLDKYNVKVELTTTDRVGFHKYTYPKGATARVMIDLREGNGSSAYDTYIRQIDDYTLEGYRFVHGWSPTHKVFFTLKSNQKIKDFSVYDDNTLKEGKELHCPSAKGIITFGDIENVMLKVGISSVSCENAAANIQSEVKDWNFDQVVDKNSKKWNAQLDKIKVSSKDETGKRVLYTAFYHTMIAPTLYCDCNGEYRGHDDKIYKNQQHTNYSTFSLWDTYRAAQPLMTILQPEKVNDMVNSMLSMFDQQGKLPIWPLVGGETNQMPGYSAIPVIADAYLKGFTGFDAEKAFEAMVTSATYKKQNGIPFILEKEYIPCDKIYEATSIAMEYAVDDWGIAAMAQKMGKTKDYETFSKRAQYYKHYFDSSIGFIRPKMNDGSWRTPYDPARSIHGVGDFCEGNGWQYTFFVPQDPYGLIELLKGDEAFTDKLDQFFTNNDDMGEGASSDITGLIGQYAHGNEPSHHIAYLYAFAGKQWKTAEKVRFIMNDFYTDKNDGIIGNEDCGQMSAWYILSAMGFYQVNPSKGVYTFGSPRYEKMNIRVQNGKTFTIEAVNNSKENIYIQSAELNGKPYSKSYILHEDIMNGGHLKLIMGNTPNKNFGSQKTDRPF